MSTPTFPRTLHALPFLLLPALMLSTFIFFAPSIGPFYEPMLAARHFTYNGVSAPLLDKFYGLPPVDVALANIGVGFAQLLLWPADTLGYWHLLLFLGEWAGVYGLVFLESCRGVYGRSWLRFPSVVMMVGQLICVGNVLPIYLFLLYINTPLPKILSSSSATAGSSSSSSIPAASANAFLPAVVLGYFTSHFPSFFHPDLAARHWWSWVWQLYPVWTGLLFIAFTRIFFKTQTASASSSSSVPVVQRTIGILGVVSTCTYWYILSTSNLSLRDLFLPEGNSPFQEPADAAPAALRLIVKYDYLTSYGAVLLWLGLSFRDLKAAGIVDTSWVVMLGLGGLAALGLGPGSMLMLGWCVREQVLASRGGRGDEKRL